MIPKHGEIIWIDLNPQRGHEQAGHRPALVLSNSRYNALTKLVVVCPITQTTKNYPTEISLPDNLQTKGVVLAGQIRTLDWQTRGFRAIEKLPNETLQKVIELINTIFEA